MARLSLVAGVLAFAMLVLAAPVLADTTANCTFEETIGTWRVSMSEIMPTPQAPSLDCTGNWTDALTVEAHLSYPNVAVIGGVRGNFTMIYNQGFEMWVDGKITFAFFDWNRFNDHLCGKTQAGGGWSHTADGQEWRCVSMTKIADDHSPQTVARRQAQATKLGAPVSGDVAELAKQRRARHVASARRLATPYTTDYDFLEKMNKAAEGWFTVKAYPEWEGMSIGELERMRGSTNVASPFTELAPVQLEAAAADLSAADEAVIARSEAAQGRSLRKHAPRSKASLPRSWDWRNVSGENFVSPVSNQGSCGSCYVFSGQGMLEARIRVRSNNKHQPILSAQDVVSCSNYAQGCDGGFPYLIGGKYAHDYGFAEEKCYPYTARNTKCNPNPQPGCNSYRWKADQYYYVGGFYGQSNEEHMMNEIYTNGPIAVSFMAYSDLHQYSGGVYTHKFAAELGLSDYNPFVEVNHAVVCVGWGETDDGIPYWIIKNSWGASWGEKGYFRILRGNKQQRGGECGIESITVAAIPVLP